MAAYAVFSAVLYVDLRWTSLDGLLPLLVGEDVEALGLELGVEGSIVVHADYCCNWQQGALGAIVAGLGKRLGRHWFYFAALAALARGFVV